MIRRPGRTLAVAALLLLIGAGVALAGIYLRASYQLRAGREALERYHTDEAVSHLQAALAIRPHDPEVLLLLARAARRSGSPDNADRYLNEYQEVRGRDDPDLLLERVLVRAERGEVESVLNYCRTRLGPKDPAAPLVLEALAKGYLAMYQPHKAEKAVEDWLDRRPNDPQALLIQGQVRDLQGRYHDALASFRQALTADRALDEARLRLCAALMALGLAEEAEEHLKYLRRRYPDNPMVQVDLARARDRLGNPEEAEAILDEVLARRPHLPAALAARGKLALRAGRADEAEKWLREAVTREPGDAQSRYQFALCLERNGKADEAQKEHARFKQTEDDMRRSQEIAGRLMEADPHNAQLHYEMGMIALRAGAPAEGVRWLQSALKEDPNHAGAREALREHYERTGDAARARQYRAGADRTR